MQAMSVKTYVVVTSMLKDKFHNENGEIGSWLILAAGLAVAAAAAVVALGPWVAGKVTAITAN